MTNEETGKKKLKSDAVPTLFDHVNTASHRPSPSKRRRLAVEQHLPTVEPHAVDATSGEPSVSTNVGECFYSMHICIHTVLFSECLLL